MPGGDRRGYIYIYIYIYIYMPGGGRRGPCTSGS